MFRTVVTLTKDPDWSRRAGVAGAEVSFLPRDPIDALIVGLPTCASLVVDVDLTDIDVMRAVSVLLAEPEVPEHRVFVVARNSRVSDVQARSMGATHILYRPLKTPDLLAVCLPSDEVMGRALTPAALLARSIDGGAHELGALFASVLSRTAIADTGPIRRAGTAIASTVADAGVDTYLAAVRRNHGGITRHSLFVAGLAADFARTCRLSPIGGSELVLAALLHDIGKARISAQLLENLDGLTDAEFAVVRKHAANGYDLLRGARGISPPVLGAVRHHHEFLDGSGYPDGVAGTAIDPITRMLTIVDQFALLIEQRAYRLALPSERAFAVVTAMAGDGKLDGALVAAFQPVAEAVIRV